MPAVAVFPQAVKLAPPGGRRPEARRLERRPMRESSNSFSAPRRSSNLLLPVRPIVAYSHSWLISIQQIIDFSSPFFGFFLVLWLGVFVFYLRWFGGGCVRSWGLVGLWGMWLGVLSVVVFFFFFFWGLGLILGVLCWVLGWGVFVSFGFGGVFGVLFCFFFLGCWVVVWCCCVVFFFWGGVFFFFFFFVVFWFLFAGVFGWGVRFGLLGGGWVASCFPPCYRLPEDPFQEFPMSDSESESSPFCCLPLMSWTMGSDSPRSPVQHPARPRPNLRTVLPPLLLVS